MLLAICFPLVALCISMSTRVHANRTLNAYEAWRWKTSMHAPCTHLRHVGDRQACPAHTPHMHAMHGTIQYMPLSTRLAGSEAPPAPRRPAPLAVPSAASAPLCGSAPSGAASATTRQRRLRRGKGGGSAAEAPSRPARPVEPALASPGPPHTTRASSAARRALCSSSSAVMSIICRSRREKLASRRRPRPGACFPTRRRRIGGGGGGCLPRSRRMAEGSTRRQRPEPDWLRKVNLR